MLYLGVGALTWAAAPARPAWWRRRRRRGTRGGRPDPVDAALAGGTVFALGALLAWWAITLLFPRPGDCPVRAAEGAWADLTRHFPA
jgi:hypothetical protein